LKCREKRPQSSHTASDDTSLPDLLLLDLNPKHSVLQHTASDDTALPDLLLPDLNPKQSVSQHAAPDLSPGYTFNPAGTEVKHRPCEYIIEIALTFIYDKRILEVSYTYRIMLMMITVPL